MTDPGLERRMKPTLKVYYDPALLDWDEAIQRALANYPRDRTTVLVICLPETMRQGGR